MKPITRAEIMGLADYEVVREHFRGRVIAEKKARRIALGSQASCVFENRDTAMMQIQEMLRTERITREAAILHEIETYNQLVPDDHELSATVLIEIDEKADRETFLFEAKGLDRAFSLTVDGTRCPGKHDEAREQPDRTTAVHYLKFPLAPAAERALRDVLEKKRPASEVVIELTVEHARYSARPCSPGAGREPRRGPRLITHHRSVRFEDVDAAGIVFFARFSNYAHDALERFFDPLPGGYAALIMERRVGFPAVHVTTDFTAPIRYGDAARITGIVTKLGTTSCRFEFAFARMSDGRAIAKATHVHVCTDLVTMTKLPLPADLRAVLAPHAQ